MTAITTPSLDRLPAVRRARAELLLSEIQAFRDTRIEYRFLADFLLDADPDDGHPWTAARLDQALNDLAAAGLITVTAARGGDLAITKTSKEVHGK